jgi:hypothetical protein
MDFESSAPRFYRAGLAVEFIPPKSRFLGTKAGPLQLDTLECSHFAKKR